MRDYEELLGADYVEHNIHRHGLGLTRSVSVIGNLHGDILRGHVPVGKNKVEYLDTDSTTHSFVSTCRATWIIWRAPTQKDCGNDQIKLESWWMCMRPRTGMKILK